MIDQLEQDQLKNDNQKNNQENISTAKTAENSSIKSNKLIDLLRGNFQIIIIISVLILIGILLGLIPLFIPKQKTVASNQTQEIVIEQTTSYKISTNEITTEKLTTKKTETTSEFQSTTSTQTSTETSTIHSSTFSSNPTTKEITTNPDTTYQSTTELKTTIQQTTQPTCTKNLLIFSLFPSSYNSNTCPTNRAYEPNHLSLTTIYSFNYPIYQVIYCYGTRFNLKCPDNQTIHIYAAYYGMQSSTNTQYCKVGNVIHTICYNVPHIFIRQCENKNSCEMLVHEDFFGDPCFGSSNHQLFVQYQCIDTTRRSQIDTCPQDATKSSICPPIVDPSVQFERKVCDAGETFTISCPIGKVIKIICAYYGVDANEDKRCDGRNYDGAPAICYSINSQIYVESQCNNNQECTFTAFDSFINVCSWFPKSLYIQWECIIPGIIQATTVLTQAPTLPYCSYELVINGTCQSSSFSPYEPIFIKNSTSTYFGYPIYEQIICQDSRLVISCPTDLYIHIYSAYYGIQSNTVTLTCQRSTRELPAMCYIQNAFDTINSTCEYKNSCSLRAFASTMGGADLCPLHRKQLVVQYQCFEKSSLEIVNRCNISKNVPSICPAVDKGLVPVVMEKVWCDGMIMRINCNSGEKIEVLCAYYGIHPSITECESIQLMTFKSVCYFKSSFTYVNQTCSNKSNCLIDINSANFTDPCVDLDKALYVQWRCVI